MAQNILELWPCLSEEQRKTIEFAVRHCCGTTPAAARLMTCEAVIDALRKLNRKSDGYGREAHDIIEKLKRLDAERSRSTQRIVGSARSARAADPRGGPPVKQKTWGTMRRQGFTGYPVPAQRRALYLLASWRDASNRAFVRTRGFIIETLLKPTTQFIILLFGLPFFTFLMLGLAQWGSGSSCHWQFPKWFGCVLNEHDGLAAGLIGAAGALLAAWIAWTAVQRQINADRERAAADRAEAEQLLSTELSEYADGVAAALRYLSELLHGETADRHPAQAVYEAVADVAERISPTERIANYRAMADSLGWDRRIKYGVLLRGLDELRKFKDPTAIEADAYEARELLRRLANGFMHCLPNTSYHFEGLFLGSAKAMSLADIADDIVLHGEHSRMGLPS